MKQFLKFTLATILGVFLAFFLFFVIMFSIAGAISSSGKQYNLKDNSLLKITLNGTISEQSSENPFNFSIPGLPMDTKIDKQGLNDILSAIRKAKTSDQIRGIYIEAQMLNAGFVSVEEIRDALEDFRKSGKYVIAYGDFYDKREYFISSVADKVFINPSGLMNIGGLASTPVFFTEALEKIGVKIEVFKVGTFKSAVEPFINKKMSDESRLQTTENLNGIWNHLLGKISKSRGISVDDLNLIADKNTLFEPTESLISEKLVDSLMYKSEVRDYLAGLHGVKKASDLNVVSVSDMISIPEKHTEYNQDKVAVLYAEGEIYDKGTEGIVTDDMLEQIEKIKEDKNIKAVVLRVNSPGGSAYASEQIWKALAELKKTHPIVVSMGDLAASGGYYISCNANKIIASPNTLTGSIGVFGIFFNIDELTKKIGLNFDVVKTNELADLGNITRPMSDLEKRKIQTYIENSYELFVKRCSEGRNMKPEDIKKIAEGHVWTGAKAVELGLIDELGGIDRAIDVAAKLGKTDKYRLVYYPAKKDYMTMLMEQLTSQVGMQIALKFLGNEYAPLAKLRMNNIQAGVLARMDDIIIK